MAKVEFPCTDISFEQIWDPSFTSKVVDVANKYIFEDFVFHIKGPFPIDPENKKFFAGGHILHEITTRLSKSVSRKHSHYFDAPHWSPTDMDLFCLGEEISGHIRIGGTDIVRSKENTVDELLMAFDLPCCRVATDGRLNYWISLHCLNAMYRNEYYLPSYMGTKSSILKVMELVINKSAGYDDCRGKIEHISNTHLVRVEKYIKRGYNPVYCVTEKVLPWIKKGLFYIEFKEDVIPDTLSEIMTLCKDRQGSKVEEDVSLEKFKEDVKKFIKSQSVSEASNSLVSPSTNKSIDNLIKALTTILEL